MRKRWRLLTITTATIVGIGLVLGSVHASVNAAGDAVAETDHGPVKGTVADGVRQFDGIPYAAPPVNELRWTPPQDPAPWSEVRDASRPGPRCPQTSGDGQRPDDTDEDCLYLNVTAPEGTDDDPKPVMVWAHGGGLFEGSGSQYDPSRLAIDGDVVVVTFNYRLGTLGYYGHPDLEGSGNFGVQDQQAALRWVKANAAAFGGDADNVTLFGESAGGITTCAQLTSPGAEGLFDKAILQSGSCATQVLMVAPGIDAPQPTALEFWSDVDDVAESGLETATELNCPEGADQIDCMRGKSVDELLEYNTRFTTIASGTDTVPEPPDEALRAGATVDVPIMTGNTRDEATMTTAWSEIPDQPIDEKRFTELTDQAFPDHAEQVRRQYPLGDDAPANTWADIDTDRSFACPQLFDAATIDGEQPLYRYEFADSTAPPLAPFPPESRVEPGASHGSELAYLFDMDNAPLDENGEVIELNAEQRALADTMIGYWTRFARHGDPNGAGSPQWPSDAESRQTLSLAPGQDGIGLVDAAADHQCSFWDDHDRS